MKKIYFVFLVGLLSCNSTPQKIADKNIENYIKSKLNDPNSFELVSVDTIIKSRTKVMLDSMLYPENIKNEFDFHGYEKYVDSENRVRPELKEENLSNLRKIKSGELVFYYTKCTFRIEENNRKKLVRYYFELDTNYQVKNFRNISDENSIIK
ncbi:hypothetical protein [Mucilaginibacter sp.]|uniref:hypothetical protein n=1 Tax=Mucilaginibacter sp. TaxID=1882438 RepID=UPI0025F37069|nr:hypothetical protein [Mucilaginibacter sp.]